ncbi:peptidase S8 [Streptomyces dangxiongensis]|uniref:Peptidase S8 n=1 Tax=Streptomyces dangxiongensis TaxID=1442032 RepID=A0A3G2JGH0_9ACTN|nr:S8 family serine peptidase [Streptomyces dangxiongensis]AYN41506.1 peptidase S8 [Streptomyces dangxiongensis]
MRREPVGRGAALWAAGLVLTLSPTATGTPQAAAAATAGATAAAPAAVGGAPRAPRTTAAARTVTLVTGDRVTVTDLGHGRRTVTVRRPPGATGAVRTRTSDGDLTVVPDEALPYLRAGTLDRRLFDVSGLIRQGFTDAGTDALPLILAYGRNARAAVPAGAERIRTLASVRGAAVEAGRGRTFWRAFTASSGIDRVWLDGRVTARLAESNAQIGTRVAWDAGLTGKGVTVAVLDTGADLSHPDLAGRVDEARSFVDGQEVVDRDGHGTHVTSVVGGSGAASGGRERGVAPGVTLAVGKVLGDQGSGSESQIIAGMEWAARDVHARIVSMSLGTAEASDGTDPMARALDTLSRETGALFVVAAGNAGAPSSIGSPGAADAALTVGAVDADDHAAPFTSAGPRYGDNALKPDLAAPGVGVLAARSHLAPGDGYYTAMSGTSMAAPQVAGAAALLAEEHPGLTGPQLKNALMSGARRLDASPYVLGAGRVSVPDAVRATVTATGSADLGFHSRPRDTDEPVTRTLTYTNTAAGPAELRLSVRGAPDGVATLADDTLTVPAHGTASTTVTGDASRAPAGTTSGWVVAVDGTGAIVAHTVFGLVKEERYTLTVHVRDRAGGPAPADLTVQRLAAGEDAQQARVDDSGTLALRLPPGTYALVTFLDVPGGHGPDSLGLGFLTAPGTVLDRDRDVTLDGRRLREVAARVDRRTETRQLVMEYDRRAGGADLSGAVQVPLTYDSVLAAPTPRVARGTFEYRTVWRLAAPRLEVRGVTEATVQPGGTLVGGRTRLPLVDVADGPVTGVSGKAVLARLADGTDPAALARAAEDAGARALFVTDDVPGRLTAWWGTDDNTDRPLTIATVNRADAARLRAAGRVDMTGRAYPPYVYDLTQGHRGAIPDRDLTYAPGRGELAAVHVRFHAAGSRDGGEFRYSLTDAFPVGLGFQERVALPSERTDYVSAGPGRRWQETVTAADGALEERGGLVRYTGGTRPALDWFGPVWHPWLGTGLGRGQERAGDRIRLDTPGWGDSGPGHTGSGDVWSGSSGMTQTTAVRLDGTLADRRTGSAVQVEGAPADEHTYTVVTDTALDAGRWPLATRGHSEWTFRSAATPEDHWTALPLINLVCRPRTGLAGTVPGGRRTPVTLHAEYVADAPGTGTLGDARLEVSYDAGRTWRPVPLAGRDASWHGTLTVPRTASDISLRASAHDDRGGSVTQEIVRAVAVR